MFTFLSFLLFTGLVGFLTWLITRRHVLDSADGYFLAGRSLGAGVIAGSLLLTNLSTEQLVGLNGAAYIDGLCVMAWEVIAGASLVLMAIFFLPRYLAKGITTIPEFLEGRYDSLTRSITDGIFILAYMLILLPIILYSGAMGLMGILDLPSLTGIQSEGAILWLTVWTIGIIGSIYAIFGGLRSVAVSDTLNGFGLLVGGVMISYLGLRYVGDGDAWQGLLSVREAHPEKFRSLGGNDTSVPWHTLFTGVLLLNMFYWTTNQQIIQRTFAAKTLAHGQRGVMLAATFKILAPVILVLPGIIAFHIFAADEVRPDAAYGMLVKLVLPPALTGFFAAVMVGAILSSFNSALNSTATLFSLGVYRKYLSPGASDQATVRAGQIFGTIIALGAMATAPLLAGQESIFAYLQKMNGLYFIPIFAVVLMGMLTRRVPAWAANLSLVLGVAVIAAGYFVPGPADLVAAYLHEFHFLGIVFAALILLMLAVAMTSAGEEAAGEGAVVGPASGEVAVDGGARAAAYGTGNPYEAPRTTGAPERPATAVGKPTDTAAPPPIDMTPWPLVVPAGVALVGIVVAIYLWFAW